MSRPASPVTAAMPANPLRQMRVKSAAVRAAKYLDEIPGFNDEMKRARTALLERFPLYLRVAEEKAVDQEDEDNMEGRAFAYLLQSVEDVLLEREANPDENMPAKFDEDDFVRTSVRGASMPRPKNRGALARSSSWLEL